MMAEHKYKKFILFSYASQYYGYACGGMADIQGSFDTIEEAENAYHTMYDWEHDHFEIVDRDTWEIIKQK
jgi:hypothetical protein